MSKNRSTTAASQPESTAGSHPVTVNDSFAAGMQRMSALLAGGKFQAAIDLVTSLPKNDVNTNTLAVCYLRAGMVDPAIKLLRGLCLVPGATRLKPNLNPAVLRNFATAMLMSGSPSGALEILRDARDEKSPRAVQIRESINKWASNLSWLRRWDWKLNRIEPAGTKVSFDFEPGEFTYVAAARPSDNPHPAGPKIAA